MIDRCGANRSEDADGGYNSDDYVGDFFSHPTRTIDGASS
jgi:hypothetical protein